MSKTNLIKNKIEFPDFKDIEKVCKEKIIKNFPKYKNSWKDDSVTLDWWGKRLNEEIDEIFKAKSVREFVEEIPDAINILAMMYSNAIKRCTKCNKKVIEWQSLDGKIVCMECYIS
jgi:formylmethanofuran dehydrogenase subunit E